MRKIAKFLFYILIIAALIYSGIILFKFFNKKDDTPPSRIPSVAVIDNISMTSRTKDKYFEVYKNGIWEEMFIKGTNIGSSTPGRWFTEFPADRELYFSWLKDIGEMNLNTIRLYTLFDPAFYQVLKEYNENPANPTIKVIQEIWPDDFVPGCNFHNSTYKTTYKREVEKVIDALHGNLQEPGRAFRAYGNYSADVSPYILGILIGREFEPEEVESTNTKNPDINSFSGDYVKIDSGSPTEVWLAELCDFAQGYSQSAYNWQYPVGFVSWPTLDPLDHPTEQEPKNISAIPAYNDREEINPDRFYKGQKNLAGFFGAYHIYPNYPDFMNNEPGFSEVSDEEGSFKYLGYLKDFINIHPPYPAIVAEFGISTSLNTAHINPDGFHHGGISEDDQGPKIIRMVDGILDMGYGGSIIFSWADEWAKKTWNTEPYMSPWERHVLWKNAMDPEQNYGILSVEPDHVKFTGSSYKSIDSIEVDVDEAFLYLSIEVPDINWNNFDLNLGIDTIYRDKGEYKFPLKDSPPLPSGVEFLLKIKNQNDAKLQVIPSYNRAKFSYYSKKSEKGIFEDINPVVNRERFTLDKRRFPEIRSNQSILNYGEFDPYKENYNSLAHWYYDESSEKIVIRLPWMLLGVTDPSKGTVAYDETKYLKDPDSANFLTAYPKCAEETPDYSIEDAENMDDWDRLGTAETDGFLFYLKWTNGSKNYFQNKQELYMWEHWEEPSYRYRLKTSYNVLKEYYGSIK